MNWTPRQRRLKDKRLHFRSKQQRLAQKDSPESFYWKERFG